MVSIILQAHSILLVGFGFECINRKYSVSLFPMSLVDSFKSSCFHYFPINAPVILAVSGGIDSVVLCELSHQAGLNFSIAHCNFQLRGEESERDEKFIRNLSKNMEQNYL